MVTPRTAFIRRKTAEKVARLDNSTFIQECVYRQVFVCVCVCVN